MRLDGAEVDAEAGLFTSAGDMAALQSPRLVLVVLEL